MSIGIGDVLRDARRRAGCSLADASQQTRVRETYLAALEQEEFAALGGDVYVKGFITSYAKYLEIDPEPLLVAYREHATGRDDPSASRSTPAHGGSGHMPDTGTRERPAGVAVLVVLVMLIVVALIAISLRGGGEVPAAIALALLHG